MLRDSMYCKHCGHQMYSVTDEPANSVNYDIGWICNNCATSCVEEIKNGIPYKELWWVNHNGKTQQYEIFR